MIFTTMRQVLAKAADGFGVGLFKSQEFSALISEALDETGKWHQRSCPLTAPLVVFFVVAMALNRSTSIKCLLIQLLGWMRAKAPRLSLRAVTPEAVCHARERLGITPLKALFKKLADRIKAPISFRGFRVWAVDGVRMTMPDTPANEAEFGRPGASRGTAAFPQMMAIAIVETTSRLIQNIVLGKHDAAERDGCEQMLTKLGLGDLLLMDSGFAAAWLFNLMMTKKIKFLSRIGNTWNPVKIKRLGVGDWLVQVSGPDCSTNEVKIRKSKKEKIKTVVLTLRMIEYKIGENERVRILTDLIDPIAYPARELAVLYHSRWEIELSYDELKTHLATVSHGTLHTVFRSKTPDGVRQEAYGLFVAYNLIRALMQEAGEKYDIPPLEISFVETLHVVRNAIPDFERASTEDLGWLNQRLLADIAACRLERPRRNRAYPRVVKVKMTKFKCKRSGHRQTMLDFEAELRLCG